MAPAPGVDDAPSESATTPVSDSSPAEGQIQDMEVEDKGIHPHPASPVSCKDDNLLIGSEAMGVELDLAHLTVLSPRGKVARVRKPPSRRHSPHWLQCDWEALSVAASRTAWKKKRRCRKKSPPFNACFCELLSCS